MQIKLLRLYLIAPLLLLFIIWGNTVRAAEPVVHISPKPTWLNTVSNYDKPVPARDVDNGYFYQLLEEQVQVEKQEDYTHVIRVITSDEGIQNGSEISITFDPTYEKLNVHEITIWRNNKPQNRLTSASFKVTADEKELDQFIYQGTYSAYCILSDVRKGDKIEYSYTVTGRNPIFGDKFFRDLYLQQTRPIAHLYKSIQVSPSRVVNFKAFNKVPKTVISVNNGLKCYTWEDFQVKAGQDYDNEPGWYNNYSYIQISDYGSWKDVVDWGLKINPLETNIKGDLAARIKTLKVDAHGDKQLYFRNAVKMVQDEIRYMGVEIGEYSHKANNPEKVYNQRYGDCKDKALLLASVLNADGIEAHMVLINTSAKSKTDQYIPSPDVFDHAVLVATIDNKQVWADATISNQRGTGVNLYFPNYGEGLILKPVNNALSNIPLTKTGKIICAETYTVTSDTGKVSLDVKTTYTLNEADNIRDKFASTSITETEKSYLDYYAKTWPKIESKDSITTSDDENKNIFVTNEHYIINDFFKPDTETHKDKVSFYADYIYDQLSIIPNRVNGPVAINYPCNIDYTTVVVLPVNWNVENRHKELKTTQYDFKSSVRTVADSLFLNYQLYNLTDFVPANKLDDFRAGVKEITYNQLSYAFDYIPDVSKVPVIVNYWLLMAAILVAGILCWVCIRIYRNPTAGAAFVPRYDSLPIGGWLVLILIGLTVSALALVIKLSSDGFFDMNKWDAKHFTLSDTAFKISFVFETLGNVVLLCYACFCLVLLLNKRDILPKYIIGLWIFALVFFIADYFLTLSVYGKTSDNAAYAIIRSIIAAGIWIPYFMVSKRVERTFVVPYPANNYFYQQSPPSPPLQEPQPPVIE